MIETAQSKYKLSFFLKSVYQYISALSIYKLIFAALFLGIFLFTSELRNLTIETMAEAYIQVSCFVAATLAIFYTLEYYFKIDTKKLLKKYEHYQVPIAALLGALPGCGGAIIIVTQYVRGRISFGAVVATLTATMGDAAFLLLAQEPLTGLMIFIMGLSVGIISGYIVDAIHGKDFLRPEETLNILLHNNEKDHGFSILNIAWILMIIPGFILAIMAAIQILPENNLITSFGAFGAFLSIFMWGYLPKSASEKTQPCIDNNHICDEDAPAHVRVINDTNFVTMWVVLAFLIYEYFAYLSGFDLRLLFENWLYMLPLIAIVIGFIPGCGPQVVVTTLYLQGIIPLSAQIGNAISNDGDALFPAIALAPRASVIATLYSAIPAVIIAYIYMFFFEL